MDPPKAIVRGNPPRSLRRMDSRGKVSAGRVPEGVACLVVHRVGHALLPHLPTHTHTVRQTTVGVGTWVALGLRECPVGQCTMGLAVKVIVRTEFIVMVDVGLVEGSNGLAVVLRLSGSRSPSEWSVDLGFHLNGLLGLGFHLNVPLSRWTWKGIGDVGGVM